MMKEEFIRYFAGIANVEEINLGSDIIAEINRDYDEIEKVYMYHPAEYTKKDIAGIYFYGGISAIKALIPAAEVEEEKDKERYAIKVKISTLNAEIRAANAEIQKLQQKLLAL